MNRISLALSCTLFLLAAAPSAAAVEPIPGQAGCDTAETCLQRLRQRQVSGNKRQLKADDDALIERLLSFGPEIVPALVDMLADPNESAAELAGFALRETKHLDRRFLPQIKAGLDRGLGWLAPALCRMEGDDVAREAVARFVVSRSAPNNQEAFALKICGRRAIAPMVEAARCANSCPADVHANLAAVLADMKEMRAEAVPGLLAIARDDRVANEVAAGALQMITAVGSDAREREPELLQLRAQRPALTVAIDEVLVAIGSAETGQIFLERLAISPDVVTLHDLAEAGAAGVRAGPAVVKLLDSEDWNLRVVAARTLGFIGYAEAAGALIRRLDDVTDVRLNRVAAESLGRLQSQAALPALRATADTHWYPPVRNAAAQAVEHIEQRKSYESRFHRDDFAFEFFDFEHLGQEQASCSKPLPKRKPESKRRKLYTDHASAKLDTLAFETVVIGYGPATPPEPAADGKNEVIELTPDNLVEHRTPTRQVPTVALRVDGGWLAGSNRGEWGGELVFIADNGSVDRLLAENVEDIYRLGGQIVALTGLAHLSSNRGMVHSVSRDASGDWSVRPWRALPGAPARSWPVKAGEVLIDVASGGTLLLHPDGAFRMAPCADK